MADGLWTGVGGSEVLRQTKLTRHRLLAVNTSAVGARAADGSDASSFASLSPNAMGAAQFPDGGPHFIMSPETPSGNPTLGFQWGICDSAVIHQDPAIRAQFAAGGVDVTVWVLVESTFFPNGGDNPQWLSFQTLTGVQPGQLFRSFDVDASCLRFQIGPTGITVDGVVVMAFAEI
jgi:hypothetical protein